MIKKRFYLKDIEHNKNDEVLKYDIFTDDSYIVVDIPSIREKASLSALFRGKTNEEIEDITLKRVLDMVVEVSAATKEGDIIRDMDHLTIFPFDVLMGFLGDLIKNGYVPKKIQTV